MPASDSPFESYIQTEFCFRYKKGPKRRFERARLDVVKNSTIHFISWLSVIARSISFNLVEGFRRHSVNQTRYDRLDVKRL